MTALMGRCNSRIFCIAAYVVFQRVTPQYINLNTLKTNTHSNTGSTLVGLASFFHMLELFEPILQYRVELENPKLDPLLA